MEIKLAENYGFCFGVKRAIKLAEQNSNAVTLGPLIHNPKEIDRLEKNFSVKVNDDISAVKQGGKAIIRTHGIEKKDFEKLKETTADIIDATCPFVTKPQEIVEKMSKSGYQIVIFGDSNHPEVKGVRSYAEHGAEVVADLSEVKKLTLRGKIALVSQTTKNVEVFKEIAAFLAANTKEVRIFNTICNATFDNQDAARKLSNEADIMLIVGGKNSANTKQLHAIALEKCPSSYLIEDKNDLDLSWFEGKKLCGVTAGASTPDWIIDEVINAVKAI